MRDHPSARRPHGLAMPIMPLRLWTELTTTDLKDADTAPWIAVLPVAAVEQHGPHLPLGTDTIIMDGYLARVGARVAAELPVVLLPVQSCGCSVEHTEFPGTLSLSAKAALAAWSDIVRSVARAGIRKLVVINSHGGNSALVDILAHEMRAELGLLVVLAAWQRFGYPAALFSEAERTHGIHGGDVETSLMLAFRPELVRMEEARDFVPASVAMEARFRHLRTSRPAGFGWMAQDLSRDGAMGNAAAATAVKGEACAEHGASAFLALLEDLASLDPADLLKRS